MTDIRVTWQPRTVPAWSYADEWSNEFSAVLDRALTEEEFDAYYDWSAESTVSGTVEKIDREGAWGYEGLLVIKLDRPASGLGDRVGYNGLVVLGAEEEPTEHPALAAAWRAYEEAHKS